MRRIVAAGTATPVSVPGMTLDPGLIEKLGDDRIRAGPDVWSGIDFGWMAQLSEYDYWDVDRNAVRPKQDFWSDTEPDSRDLWAWSKLRIAKGVHEHALAPALAEVQELARLCLTVERFPTQLAGIAMLRQARKAAEREAPALSSRTADNETTDQMLRALSAARGFARLETPASYERDLDEVVVGRAWAHASAMGVAPGGVRWQVPAGPVQHGRCTNVSRASPRNATARTPPPRPRSPHGRGLARLFPARSCIQQAAVSGRAARPFAHERAAPPRRARTAPS